MSSMIFLCGRILLPLLLLLAAGFPLLRADIISRDGPLVTVRESATAILGEGTKPQVYEKAKREALRKAIELAGGLHISVESTLRNFELTEDVLGAYQRVFVRSIREISYSYDPAAERGAYEGEFVIDTSTLATVGEAQRALQAGRARPVEAGVFLFDGDGQALRDGATVREGVQFNVMVEPAGDLHAYIVSQDSRGRLYAIFPNPQVSPQRNPLRAGQRYAFPSRGSPQIFAFDEHPGRETFSFVLSSTPLDDLDALFTELASRSEGERADLSPIVADRIASRGFTLQAKRTEARLDVPTAEGIQVETVIGERIKGQGALVKTITLEHVR